MMNNPEKFTNQLNFTNLFKKAKASNLYSDQSPSKLSKSQLLSSRQNISHRTPNFIPKYPYGRSSSVNSNRKQQYIQNESAPIFSVLTFESKKSLTHSLDLRPVSPLRLPTPSPSSPSPTTKRLLSFQIFAQTTPKTVDKFQILRVQQGQSIDNQIQKKVKIRGLKVRLGSQAKKIKNRVQFDYNNVSVQGKKIGNI